MRVPLPAAVQLLSWHFYIASNVLLAVCLLGLFRRRGWGKYPLFLSYLVLQLTSFLVAFTLDRLILRSPDWQVQYRWAVIISLVASAALEICVLYELSERLILSRSPLGATLRPVLQWSGAVLLLVSAATSAILVPAGLNRVLKIFEILNFSSHLIVLGMLFVLLLFSEALQVPWRSLPAGIALGFGIDASIEIASSAVVSAIGSKSLLPTDLIRMSALMACALVWVVYVFVPDRPLWASGRLIGKTEMELWDQELQRMVGR
jgi:hypothetical protein